MLPVPQRAFIAVVDFDHVEQGRGPLMPQPAIEAMTEGTEVVVLAVAEREHCVSQTSAGRSRD